MEMTRSVPDSRKLSGRGAVVLVVSLFLCATPSFGQEVFGLQLGENSYDVKLRLARQGHKVFLAKDRYDEKRSHIEVVSEPVKTDYMEFEQLRCDFFLGSLHKVAWGGRLLANKDSAARLRKLVLDFTNRFGDYQIEGRTKQKLELDEALLRRIAREDLPFQVTWTIEHRTGRVDLSKRVKLFLSGPLFLADGKNLDIGVQYEYVQP